VRNQKAKRVLSWLVVIVGVLGIGLSYYSAWIIAAYFVAGVAWFASLALFASGPVCGLGAFLARRKPRQKAAFVIGLTGLALWIILWVLFLTIGGFGFDRHH